MFLLFFFFSSRRRHTISPGDWSSDVCSSDLPPWTEGSSESLALLLQDLELSGSGQHGGCCMRLPHASRCMSGISRTACTDLDWPHVPQLPGCSPAAPDPPPAACIHQCG